METLNEILASDAHEELFLLSFNKMIEKFVNEYEDMSQMKAINQASELLETFNQ